MQKKFVVDTSVFMNDEDAFLKFEENEVIIPSIVWEELNNNKDSDDSMKRYLPKRVLKVLAALADVRPLREGVKLKEISEDSPYYEDFKNLETTIRLDYNVENEEVTKAFTLKKNDYKIIACAKNNNAILVTSDIGMLGIAKDFVKAEEYKAADVKSRKMYKGYRFVEETPDTINDFYKKKTMEDKYNLFLNEFVVMNDIENEKHVAIGIKKSRGIKLIDFDKELNFSRMKSRPVNLEQKMFLYLLQDPEILCITVTGISGKGKTLVGCDYAFSEIEKGTFNKFLYSKSIIPTDVDEYMGFTKGTDEEKFNTHISALFTAIEFLYKDEIYGPNKKCTLNEKVEQLVNEEKLGTLPLANIRGMNIFKKIVMLDEAQNTKRHVMKSLVSRLTDESKLIVSGDIEQIDDPKLNEFNNGLSHLIEKGKDEEFIAHICLDIDKGESKRGRLSTFGAKKL